jgi:energy-coupling factor transport system permease protein
MRPVNRLTFPRGLHPGAWWLWGIGLAAAASRTTNPLLLLLIVAVSGFVAAARRSDTPWAGSYGAFLKLGLVIIAIRIFLQAILSSSSQGVHILFTLPQVPLPGWAAGVKLGGVVTDEAVMSALYAGLQLATILCCIGAVNSVASARRLLRSLPGALYEVGVAVAVALTFAPQLVTDAARVRAAHRLRGRPPGGMSGLRRTVIPVLEGALERCIELAAAMDARGYGRTSEARPGSRRVTGILVFGGLLGITVGVYGLMDASTQTWLGLPVMLGGCLLAGMGLAAGGRRTTRSRYRPDPWALPEWLVAGSGLVAAAGTFIADPRQLQLAGPLEVPSIPYLAVVAVLAAITPAFTSPPLPHDTPVEQASERDSATVGVAS